MFFSKINLPASFSVNPIKPNLVFLTLLTTFLVKTTHKINSDKTTVTIYSDSKIKQINSNSLKLVFLDKDNPALLELLKII